MDDSTRYLISRIEEMRGTPSATFKPDIQLLAHLYRAGIVSAQYVKTQLGISDADMSEANPQSS